MLKSDEIADNQSCFNKARPGEMIFVLLERDEATPDTIRFWANRRVRLGKNTFADGQIKSALACADAVEKSLGLARPPAEDDAYTFYRKSGDFDGTYPTTSGPAGLVTESNPGKG